MLLSFPAGVECSFVLLRNGGRGKHSSFYFFFPFERERTAALLFFSPHFDFPFNTHFRKGHTFFFSDFDVKEDDDDEKHFVLGN
jgi:hypothetical protein